MNTWEEKKNRRQDSSPSPQMHKDLHDINACVEESRRVTGALMYLRAGEAQSSQQTSTGKQGRPFGEWQL